MVWLFWRSFQFQFQINFQSSSLFLKHFYQWLIWNMIDLCRLSQHHLLFELEFERVFVIRKIFRSFDSCEDSSRCLSQFCIAWEHQQKYEFDLTKLRSFRLILSLCCFIKIFVQLRIFPFFKEWLFSLWTPFISKLKEGSKNSYKL